MWYQLDVFEVAQGMSPSGLAGAFLLKEGSVVHEVPNLGSHGRMPPING
jgi:hypothetical protein